MVNDCWGWTDLETGSEYAIIGLDNGTAFVDITIPNQPVILGKLPSQTVDSMARQGFGNYVYVVSSRKSRNANI